MLSFPRLAQLSEAMTLGRVELREIGPSQRQFQKFQQQGLLLGTDRSDRPGERVKMLEPETPKRQHLPDRDSLAGADLSGRFEECAVVALAWTSTLFQALGHRCVAVAHELAPDLHREIVIRAHRPRALDGLLDGRGDIATYQCQQLNPAVGRHCARRLIRVHLPTLPEHVPTSLRGGLHRAERTSVGPSPLLVGASRWMLASEKTPTPTGDE